MYMCVFMYLYNMYVSIYVSEAYLLENMKDGIPS